MKILVIMAKTEEGVESKVYEWTDSKGRKRKVTMYRRSRIDRREQAALFNSILFGSRK